MPTTKPVKWRKVGGAYLATVRGLHCEVSKWKGGKWRGCWTYEVWLTPHDQIRGRILDHGETETDAQRQCERWVERLAKKVGAK